MVKQLFPDLRLEVDYKPPDLKLFSRQLEYDVFIPSLSLAFEYNGEQHYKPSYKWNSAFAQDRDQQKKIVSKEAGITLVVIPYWWNHSYSFLYDTLVSQRPDLQLAPVAKHPH
jgi:hypothetical protein